MTETVELFSKVDPLHAAVWYWTEFQGMYSDFTEYYGEALERAEAILREHDACLVDRSDRGTGLLRSTLGR